MADDDHHDDEVDLASILLRVLDEPIKVKDGGKTVMITRWDMACRQMAKKAAAGDVRAFKSLMQLQQANPEPEEVPNQAHLLSPEDYVVL